MTEQHTSSTKSILNNNLRAKLLEMVISSDRKEGSGQILGVITVEAAHRLGRQVNLIKV